MIPKWRYMNGAWRRVLEGRAVDGAGTDGTGTDGLGIGSDRERRVRARGVPAAAGAQGVAESPCPPSADDRRTDPRLRLCYPIEVRSGDGVRVLPPSRTVTQDLSARGAYFCTANGDACEVGRTVTVVVTVPHRLVGGGAEVSIDLRGAARVVRVDRPARGSAGEDGVALAGIALAFDGPLDFSYAWQ